MGTKNFSIFNMEYKNVSIHAKSSSALVPRNENECSLNKHCSQQRMESRGISIKNPYKSLCSEKISYGGVLHYGVRRGSAPVLGSVWPENSGIGTYLYCKISVIGVYCYAQNSGNGY